jgi:hypothetical protein
MQREEKKILPTSDRGLPDTVCIVRHIKQYIVEGLTMIELVGANILNNKL